MKKAALFAILGLIALITYGCNYEFSTSNIKNSKQNNNPSADTLKLYWFIPDGMRADPDLFNIFKWAEEGKLPNIKRMMDEGSYGFSKPDFPGHTPTNFATLLTGTHPDKHGVADGPMHVEGRPLDKVAIGGFSSVAKKITPIWSLLEDSGEKVLLLSIPGSTPPELDKGITIRGRWGGWGFDVHALNFESKKDLKQRREQGRGSRLFFFGPELTRYIDDSKPEGWDNLLESFSPIKEVKMSGWGADVYALIYDGSDDNEANYDNVAFSFDKETIFNTLKQGEWGNWQDVRLKFQVGEKSLDVESHVIPEVIKLEDDGFFRIRLFYDNLNKFITKPDTVAGEVVENVGPMVDFADNFPPQLIFYDEDKEAFLDEAEMSLDWHRDAVDAIVNLYQPNIVLHNIYTPNQMLTSRWWLGYIDPNSKRYNDVDEEEREKLWQEVQWMYKKLDDIIGEILDNADENTYVVLSSDHGAVPLDRWVRVNNLLASNGLLKFEINPETGEPIIDWASSKAIYLKMDNIYINPNGLAGDYHRASGPEYDELRNKIIDLLINLEDDNGKRPIAAVTKWEDASKFHNLPADRVGDLVIANEAGYGWNEEMTEDLEIFDVPLISGYKQAIIAEDVPAMWAPFIIMGPGIKKNNFLGNNYIENVDQFPTIMTALKKEVPDNVDGKVLDVFE